MWWELESSNGFVNGDLVSALNFDGNFKIIAATTSGNRVLKGSYSDAADAQRAIRELCQGIDPIVVTEGT